jgi:tRNA(Ile2) C34 agmatinyltransferase TiaS
MNFKEWIFKTGHKPFREQQELTPEQKKKLKKINDYWENRWDMKEDFVCPQCRHLNTGKGNKCKDCGYVLG